jgi:hypothetical protein
LSVLHQNRLEDSDSAVIVMEKAEQDVFRADVVVAQVQRFAEGAFETLLRTRGELGRIVAFFGQRPLAGSAYKLARLLDFYIEAFEGASGKPIFFAKKSDENVLRPNVSDPVRPRFFLSEDDHLTGALCKSFVHYVTLCS